MRINLLPWRDREKKRQKKRLYMQLFFIVSIWLFVMLGVHCYVNSQLEMVSLDRGRYQMKWQAVKNDLKIREKKQVIGEEEKRKNAVENRLTCENKQFIVWMKNMAVWLPITMYLKRLTVSQTEIKVKGMFMSIETFHYWLMKINSIHAVVKTHVNNMTNAAFSLNIKVGAAC